MFLNDTGRKDHFYVVKIPKSNRAPVPPRMRAILKGNRIYHPKICLFDTRIILDWLFLRNSAQEKLWKLNRSYPFVRDIYVYKENLHLWRCFPQVPGGREWLNLQKTWSLEKTETSICVTARPRFTVLCLKNVPELSPPSPIIFFLVLAEDSI